MKCQFIVKGFSQRKPRSADSFTGEENLEGVEDPSIPSRIFLALSQKTEKVIETTILQNRGILKCLQVKSSNVAFTTLKTRHVNQKGQTAQSSQYLWENSRIQCSFMGEKVFF